MLSGNRSPQSAHRTTDASLFTSIFSQHSAQYTFRRTDPPLATTEDGAPELLPDISRREEGATRSDTATCGARRHWFRSVPTTCGHLTASGSVSTASTCSLIFVNVTHTSSLLRSVPRRCERSRRLPSYTLNLSSPEFDGAIASVATPPTPAVPPAARTNAAVSATLALAARVLAAAAAVSPTVLPGTPRCARWLVTDSNKARSSSDGVRDGVRVSCSSSWRLARSSASARCLSKRPYARRAAGSSG